MMLRKTGGRIPLPPGFGFKHPVSQFWVAYKSVTAVTAVTA